MTAARDLKRAVPFPALTIALAATWLQDDEFATNWQFREERYKRVLSGTHLKHYFELEEAASVSLPQHRDAWAELELVHEA